MTCLLAQKIVFLLFAKGTMKKDGILPHSQSVLIVIQWSRNIVELILEPYHGGFYTHERLWNGWASQKG